MYRPPKRTCEKNSKWLLFFASGSPSLAFSLRLSCFNQHVLTTAIRPKPPNSLFVHLMSIISAFVPASRICRHNIGCVVPPLQPFLLPIFIVAASPSLQSMPFSSVCDADHAYALRQRGAVVCKAPLDSLLSHVHFYCDIACACGVQVQF